MEHRRPAAAGHRHVGDHQVGVAEDGLLEGLGGVGRLADLPAAQPEEIGDLGAGLGLVVDDQSSQHRKLPVRADWVNQP